MVKEHRYTSKPNPEKAASRVNINSFMSASLFFILTLVWTLNPEKFSPFIIVQLILAIPFLFVSSLAYSKVGYWEDVKLWDNLGWITNHFGNVFVLNVAGLMAATFSKTLAFIYFGLLLSLMVVYSVINIMYNKNSFNEKLLKFLLFLATVFFGGILPLL